MAYKAIMRHSDFGRDHLMNLIDDFDHEGTMTDDEKDDMLTSLINQIVIGLPVYIEWSPDTSEIFADEKSDADLDEDEIREVFKWTIDRLFKLYGRRISEIRKRG